MGYLLNGYAVLTKGKCLVGYVNFSNVLFSKKELPFYKLRKKHGKSLELKL